MIETFHQQVFTPIQPTVRPSDPFVAYTELTPESALTEFIYCYWRLKSWDVTSPFTYRVIPDGCIDIFFDLNNVNDSSVMGCSTSYSSFDLGLSFDYIGIRFMPAAFTYLFKIDASLLTNKDERLGSVVPIVSKQLSVLLEGVRDFQSIKKIFDHYFLKKIEEQKFSVDHRLHHAILRIFKTHGALHLESEIDTGLSPRQLRRLFDFYVGTSPKMFCKIIRFQYFFQLLTSSHGPGYNKLLYDAGYYDQPHFVKDFKSFFGLTPSEALHS